MIPPELRERLIRTLTQKLVDSPIFNAVVRNTHSTIDEFLAGMDEGRIGKAEQKEGNEQPANQRHGQSSQSQSTQSQQQHEHEQGRTRSQQSTYEQPSQSHQTQSSRYSQAHEFEKPHQPPAQPDASPQREQSRMASQQAEESAPSNGAKQNENLAEKELSALEAFLKRTRDDLKEAERRASERE